MINAPLTGQHPLDLSGNEQTFTEHTSGSQRRPPLSQNYDPRGQPATAAMFKPTQALFRRFRKLRLTTKDVKKGFYKGTGTGRMGTHDRWGGYTIDYNLVRTYVVPKDLDTFKVRFPSRAPPPTLFSGTLAGYEFRASAVC